ncbi:hypothetical protein L1887_20280 [Cichorium endivia]|nr:hypothetical protein L1887_20280 [Cichorium endivia]
MARSSRQGSKQKSSASLKLLSQFCFKKVWRCRRTREETGPSSLLLPLPHTNYNNKISPALHPQKVNDNSNSLQPFTL